MANYSPRTHCMLFCFIIALLLFESCKEQKPPKEVISEGIIHYKITYPPEISRMSASFLLPDKMDFYFQPNKVRASFKGSLGLYALDFISNHVSDSSITLLKILDKKMYVPGSESNRLFIFNNLKSAHVTLNNDTTRKIAGYKAHMATVNTDSKVNFPVVVWYTPEVKTKTTNKNTPFSKIPGVMLEFDLHYNNILFKLRTESVDAKPLPPSTFKVPPDYQATSMEEIETTISGLLK